MLEGAAEENRQAGWSRWSTRVLSSPPSIVSAHDHCKYAGPYLDSPPNECYSSSLNGGLFVGRLDGRVKLNIRMRGREGGGWTLVLAPVKIITGLLSKSSSLRPKCKIIDPS